MQSNQTRQQPRKPQRLKWYSPTRTKLINLGLCGLFGLLVGFTWRVPEITEKIKFFAGGFLSLLAVVVIVVQAEIYRRQREIMEGQLYAAQTQSMILHNQAGIGGEQKEILAKQHEAMIEQLKVMEGALKATRDSVDVAWDALKTGKRAYLGVNRMNIDLVKKKRLAIYITNTGKTPASGVIANLYVTISTPVGWHENQPENIRLFALGKDDYSFNLTTVSPNSIPVRIGFPLGKYFTNEELAFVVQKKSRLTVNLTIEYQDGFGDGFSNFVLTYRGKDSHGRDSWGIFPTESEKEYDQTNPEHTEWKIV